MADPGQQDPHLAGDILESGSRTGRRLPRWLVVTAEVLIGTLLAGFLVVQALKFRDEEAPNGQNPLRVVKGPDVSAGLRSATVTVDLRNVSGGTLIIDTAAVLKTTQESTSPSAGAWSWTSDSAYAPGWISANVYPTAQTLVTAYDSRLLPLEVPGEGGTATLVVTVQPPCQRSSDVGTAEVVVAWHTAGGTLGQETVPGVLQIGDTRLADLVENLCVGGSTEPPEPMASTGVLDPGRTYDVSINRLPVSFEVPEPGWERISAVAMSKGTKGSDHADAVVYVTDMVRANGIRACGQWWGAPDGTLGSWAHNAAQLRGGRVVLPASPTTLDDVPGVRVVVRIVRADPCNPGLNYTWRPLAARAPWTGIQPGDTVRIWLVRVASQVVYIEADTHRDADRRLRHEVLEIVHSVQFG